MLKIFGILFILSLAFTARAELCDVSYSLYSGPQDAIHDEHNLVQQDYFPIQIDNTNPNETFNYDFADDETEIIPIQKVTITKTITKPGEVFFNIDMLKHDSHDIRKINFASNNIHGGIGMSNDQLTDDVVVNCK